MNNFWITFTLGGLLGAFIPAIEGYFMAKYHRNRNPWIWFVSCYLTGLFALMMLICSPTLEYNEELDYREDEILGVWVLLLSIVLSVITIWFVYSVISGNLFSHFY